MSSNMPQHDPVPGADHAPATAVERSAGTDPGAGYERRDANIRSILWLAAGVTITCALVFWGLIELSKHFEAVAKSNDPEISPLADTKQIPPAPRLQDNSFRDLEEFRAVQDRTLASYAWINRQDGVVQIPVDRAMELILERGLPTPTGPTGPQQQEGQQPSGQQASGQDQAGSQPPPDESRAPAPIEATPSEQPSDRQPPENR